MTDASIVDAVFLGIETGGTKIVARLESGASAVLAEARWPTSTPAQALADLVAFITEHCPVNARLAAIGIAAFGPLKLDRKAIDHGAVLATPKPHWAGANLRAALSERFGVPVAIDTDVNAAALAEHRVGAGCDVSSIAYVTVGTGIGGGLLTDGRVLTGAMHPEIGHIRMTRLPDDDLLSTCPYHDDCVEGLASGPAIARRLRSGHGLADDPLTRSRVVHYLGQLAATLVLAWSPHRIVWGGGVMATPGLLAEIEGAMRASLRGYSVGHEARCFCVAAALVDSGLTGALLLARAEAHTTEPA